MRVLTYVTGFYPSKKYGGPPISIANIAALLEKDISFYIVTTDHEMGESKRLSGIKEGWNYINGVNVYYLSDSDRTISKFKKIAQDVNPDLIYLNSLFDIFTTVPLLIVSKILKIKVILAPRGEICEGAFIKKYKKIPYIYLLRLSGLMNNVGFHSTSIDETTQLSHVFKINANKIQTISNVPSIPIKKYDCTTKISGTAKFVFISRIVRKKNLKEAILYFKNIRSNVTFDIYGSLEDYSYWNECKKEIEKMPSNVQVSYRGVLEHSKIHDTFATYHAFIFPTLSENYGHVIAEALSVGCPVIVSDQTPWNIINDFRCGIAIPLENKESIIEFINNIIKMNNKEFAYINKRAKECFNHKMDLKVLKKEYLKMFCLT